MAKKTALFCLLSALLCSPLQSKAHEHEETGEALYLKYCAPCHGTDGSGNGKEGIRLSPPPADLRLAMGEQIISDEYLMWTIREGGQNIHTDMPSFEESSALTQREAYKIIRYLWDAFK
ncbi:cytochrome c [Terasakiella sp. SH-1]|uniref:c-type cytochrome n=1 Tax=Terasakiella sp. SH-1 TaxID=2560057 RepID=UPI0014307772|nr:cytochrome c [Terasakiella sp. SH-1]